MIHLLIAFLLLFPARSTQLDPTPFELGGTHCTPIYALPSRIGQRVACVPPHDLVLVFRHSETRDVFRGLPGWYWAVNYRGTLGWIRADDPSWSGMPA